MDEPLKEVGTLSTPPCEQHVVRQTNTDSPLDISVSAVYWK